jgi:hypothetical protein
MSRHNQMIAKYQEEIVAKKLRAKKDELAREKARYQKFKKNKKGSHRSSRQQPEYTRYEDLPPPNPEERERFMERLDDLVGNMMAEEIEEKAQAKQAYFDWLLHFAEDWP